MKPDHCPLCGWKHFWTFADGLYIKFRCKKCLMVWYYNDKNILVFDKDDREPLKRIVVRRRKVIAEPKITKLKRKPLKRRVKEREKRNQEKYKKKRREREDNLGYLTPVGMKKYAKLIEYERKRRGMDK